MLHESQCMRATGSWHNPQHTTCWALYCRSIAKINAFYGDVCKINFCKKNICIWWDQFMRYLIILYFHVKNLILIGWKHLVKSISPAESWNHALTLNGTWQRKVLLDDGWYSKKYRLRKIYARTVHHRFWLASYERLNLRSTKYTLKYLLDLDCFETKRTVDVVFN